MNDFTWALSHRQLVSAVIALALPSVDASSPLLNDLGYELWALELPMVDTRSRPYRVDLHLINDTLNLSVLVERKTHPAVLDHAQIEKYMATTGEQVVLQGAVTTNNPRDHAADAAFVILPDVESALATIVRDCHPKLIAGWAIVRVTPARIELAHGEFSDPSLSTSLTAGWDVDIERLPLERLPYEPDAPRWELANVVLQTILSLFVSGRREFALDEICAESNPLWPYLTTQHQHIRRRIRDEIRTLRRTALRGWLTRLDTESGREEQWRFSRGATINQRTLVAYEQRHQHYVSILRSEGRNPRPEEFVRVTPEQLTLPFVVEDA